MSKLNDKINVILFGGIMIFGLASTLLIPDKEFSEIENRTLAQKPAFTLQNFFSGNLDDETEKYLSDQFILRDSCVTLKSSTEALIGKKEFNGSYLTDDMLLERMDEPTEQFNTNITAVNNASNALGIPLSLALVPTATDVYKDTLPNGAPTANQQKLLSTISQNLNSDVNMINMSAIMHEHKDEYIYYRTDHHWTSLGAYYGFSALCQAMGIDVPELDSYADRHIVSDSFYGTTWSESGFSWVKPDEMETFVNAPEGLKITSYPQGEPLDGKLYDESKLAVKDKYSMFMGGNCPLHEIVTGNDGPSLLIIRDSYTDSLIPFLLENFSEIHVIDVRYYRMSIADYIAEHDFDNVLVAYSVSTFATDPNLFLLGR